MDNKSKVLSSSEEKQIDKNKVLKAFIQLQEKKIDSLKKSILQTKEDLFSSKDKGDSHDDPKKEMYASLMGGLEAGLAKYEKTLSNLKAMTFLEGSNISFGSLIKIENLDSGEISQYFLICTGGDVIDMDDSKIYSMSLRAPLAQALINKSENEEFKFRDQNFKVLAFQ